MTQTHIIGADPVPTSIREQARALFTQHLGDHTQDFPENAWLRFSDQWSLHLYVDPQKRQCRAMLHPVVNEEPTQVGYPVYHLSQPTRQLLFFALRAYQDYDTAFAMIEESLPREERGVFYAFLTWVRNAPDDRYFAEDTFPARFAEWENTLREG